MLDISTISSPSFSLSLAGLILLADISTLAIRTALRGGTPSLLDALILLPGLHQEGRTAVDLHKGEYPACAALTTGYVFRVENQATVFHLQRVGRSGCLTTLEVLPARTVRQGWAVSASALCAAGLTASAMALLAGMRDWWALGGMGGLVFVRLVNMLVLRRRARPGWFGALEPGVNGDLLVLLSQDRWVRIRGLVDDLKAVTSASWLREATAAESSATTFATLLVYIEIMLLANASLLGQMMLVALVLASTALVGLSNLWTTTLHMHGRSLQVYDRRQYDRRLTLANELIEETGRDDWAIRMGMIQPKHAAATQNRGQTSEEEPVIM